MIYIWGRAYPRILIHQLWKSQQPNLKTGGKTFTSNWQKVTYKKTISMLKNLNLINAWGNTNLNNLDIHLLTWPDDSDGYEAGCLNWHETNEWKVLFFTYVQLLWILQLILFLQLLHQFELTNWLPYEINRTAKMPQPLVPSFFPPTSLAYRQTLFCPLL
jgi:hypothetical protein